MRTIVAFRYIGVILLTTVLVFGHESRMVGPSRRIPGLFLRVGSGATRETIEMGSLNERLRSEGLQTPIFLTKLPQLRKEGERNPPEPEAEVEEEQYIWI